jgi:hypothetical protein
MAEQTNTSLEQTPEECVVAMVDVFREVRRVLRATTIRAMRSGSVVHLIVDPDTHIGAMHRTLCGRTMQHAIIGYEWPGKSRCQRCVEAVA